MLPLVLPLPLSTEITMQALMNEAYSYLSNGKYKLSYELYIEALLSAVKEFKQIEFIDEVKVENDLSSVFSLAQSCLRQAEDISSKCISPGKNIKQSPPPIPPKPSKLSTSPPLLPSRPSDKKFFSTDMKRAKSKPEFVKRSDECNLNMYSYFDDDNDLESEEVEGVDYGEEEEEEDTAVANKIEKVRKQKTKKASTPSLKIITNRSKISRRSSTSNISTSAPSSPISAVPNPFNAVKSFLSFPASMTPSLDGVIKRTLNSPTISNPQCNISRNEADDRFLLANGMIDPQIMTMVQTSSSDSLSTNSTNNYYLPMIPQAPLVTAHKSLQVQLEEANKAKQSDKVAEIQNSLNKVRNIHMSATTVPTILQFHPSIIAYQLTLIDSTIFRNIPIEAILTHSPKTPHATIVASTDFFNYLTRLIEHAILLQQDASGRAQHINHWIRVAGKCYDLKNYQTLKAIISALGTPPIQRLRRSWQFIPKKSMCLLDDLSDLMSEASNYGKYREKIGLATSQSQYQQQEDETKYNERTSDDYSKQKSIRKNSFSEPTVPFLGIFIHDMTYLTAAVSKKKQPTHNSQWKLHDESQDQNQNTLQQDARVSELLKTFKNLQRCPPYSPNLSAACVKDFTKNRKRRLSHALSRTTSMKKISTIYHEDDGELSIEMQQCIVTQYLLTRNWVSEKTVDELSLVRESTKTARSYSFTESLATPLQRAQSAGGTYLPPLPPLPINSSTNLVVNDITEMSRTSSGSVTSSTSSNTSRPVSLEDDTQDEIEKKSMSSGFWLFRRKSVDQANLKAALTEQYGTIHKSLRNFSFEEDHTAKKTTQSNMGINPIFLADCRMQREGSQGSLASSIFRKEFWKSTAVQQQSQLHHPQELQPQEPQHHLQRTPLINYHSDSVIPRKSSISSFAIENSPTSTGIEYRSYPLLNKNINHITSPSHTNISSELLTFTWE